MSTNIKGLIDELERFVDSSEFWNFDTYINENTLSDDEIKVVGLLRKAMNNYRAATEYELLKYQLTSSALGIAHWDMDVIDGDPVNPDNLCSWSNEFRKMLGYSGENEFPNVLSSWSNRIHPDDYTFVISAFAAHISDRTGKTPYDLEYRMKMKNGEERYFHSFGSTMRDKKGVPIRVAGALEDVTELKMIQQQAHEAEERSQILLDATPLCSSLWTKDFKNITTNEEAVKIFGVSDKQEYADRFFDFSPEFQPCGERSEAKVIKNLKEAYEKGYNRFEWMHKKANGEPLPCEVTLVRVEYNNEFIIAAYTRDLTIEKEMLGRIEATAHRYRSVLDAVPIPISVTDKDMNWTFINKAVEKLIGKKREEIIGLHCGNWNTPNCYNENCGIECAKRGIKQTYYKNKGHSYQIDVETLNNLDDEVVGYIKVIQDVTKVEMLAKKQMESDKIKKSLVQQAIMTDVSQQFLSLENLDSLIAHALAEVGEFMDVAQILLYVVDECAEEDDNRIFSCRNEWLNPKFNLTTRVGGEFLVSKNSLFFNAFSMLNKTYFYLTSENPDVRKIMSSFRVDFQNYLFTSIFVGDKLYAVLDYSRADTRRWDNDDINMAAFIANILTSAFQKQIIDSQLIAAKELAEQNDKYKSAFLASMSHEIRTPINAIMGIAEIQLMKEEMPEPDQDALIKIFDSGDLLLTIINDILDLSKIEAGKLEILPIKYDIPGLINDTIQLNRMRYESKPIVFKLIIDKNTPLDLFGDELRIKQVLNNLLSNAFKYTDTGGITLSVYPENHEESSDMVKIVLQVTDTGQGMSDEQLHRLFDEYARFNLQSNRTTVGTGLGMNITKNLVEAMDGEISVESKLGKGSVFTVRLPQKRISAAVCGAELSEKLEKLSYSGTLKTRKIQFVREYMPYGRVLVVDDVDTNLFVATGLLTPYGLTVETVTNGYDAVDKIKNGEIYDIIFMDHMMPLMDGLETAGIIRETGYIHPIVALTANAIVGQAKIFTENGFDGFISKPIDLREMNAMLNRFIRDKQPLDIIEAARLKKTEMAKPEQKTDTLAKLKTAFVWDANKSIPILEDICKKISIGEEADVYSYVISVHGLKSALANIGETELSKVALKLEKAGQIPDIDIISNDTPGFIKSIKSLITKIKPPEETVKKDISEEDTLFLLQKMVAIKMACEVFNKKIARTSLDELKKKSWPSNIMTELDSLSVKLLHSDFKKASEITEAVIAGV